MKEKKYSAPAAARAMMILEYMSKQSTSVGPSELAEMIHVTVNMGYRILTDLEQLGYVYRTSNQRYKLTPKLYYLGRLAQPCEEKTKFVLHKLKELAEQSGETAMVCTLNDNFELLLNEQVESPLPLKFVSRVGYTYPSYNSAMGKSLLIGLDDEGLEKYFATIKLIKSTERTIDNRESLIAELEKVKAQGYAYDDEESLDGVFCIGAPIYDVTDQIIISIGISGPKKRVKSKLNSNIEVVMNTAKQISSMFGKNV